MVWELCDNWVPFCIRFTPVTSVTTKAKVAPGKFTPYLQGAALVPTAHTNRAYGFGLGYLGSCGQALGQTPFKPRVCKEREIETKNSQQMAYLEEEGIK
jgi:hypothetical protein